MCLCGGLTGCKKVAALAEAQHVKVIPHNPLTGQHRRLRPARRLYPQLALQEYTGESEPPKSELEAATPARAWLSGRPGGPGLGIELREEALGKYPPVDKVLDTPLGYDGSVQDR